MSRSRAKLLEAQMYRSSNVVGNVLVPRLGILYSDKLVTEKANGSEDAVKYTFVASCKVGGTYEREFFVKTRGSSAVVAFLRERNTAPKKLYAFNVQWPNKIVTMHKHRQILAFDTLEQAEQWRKALQGLVQDLISSDDGQVHHTAVSNLEMFAHRRRSLREATLKEVSEEPGEENEELPASASEFMRVESMESVGGPVEEELVRAALAAARDSSHAAGPRDSLRSLWVRRLHADGISIYAEPSGKALMASTVIRATARKTFLRLLHPGLQSVLPNRGVKMLSEGRDLNGAVFSVDLEAPDSGMLSRSLFAPRYAVVEQTWSVESDGTYQVQFRSVDHAGAAPPAAAEPSCWVPFGSCAAPVQVQVDSAGFSISPLSDDEVPPGVLATRHALCLVTLVLQMDLGGAFSARHPLSGATWRMGFGVPWFSSMMSSLVALRDEAEHDRFLVKPGRLIGLHTSLSPYSPFASASDAADTEFPPASQEMAAGDADAAEPLLRSVPRAVTVPHSEVPEAAEVSTPEATQISRGLPQGFWSSPGAAGFKVRGTNYLSDKKKVASPEPLFSLYALHVVQVDEYVHHVSPYLPSVMSRAYDGLSFVVNFIVPHKPKLQMVLVFDACHDLLDTIDESDDDLPAPLLTLVRFASGREPADDQRRRSALKMIPRVVEGSWIMKQSVGTTPVLIGTKLDTSFHFGDGYMEATIDVASNHTAAAVTGMAAGCISSLVIDLAFLIEGKAAEELPEQLLGTARLNRVDLKAAQELDVSEPLPCMRPAMRDRRSDDLDKLSSRSRPSDGLDSSPSEGMRHRATFSFASGSGA